MTDSYTYSSSLESQENEFIMENRQYTYVGDTNAGAYVNGSIVFDLASLSNSGKLVDWSQSYLEIPLTLTITGNDSTLDQNCWAANYKNYCNLIDSMSVQISNFDCVNLTSGSNFDINYRILSEWSENTLHSLGPSVGYYKENPASIYYNGAQSASGVGECNNKIVDAAFSVSQAYNAQQAFLANTGRVERMKDSSFDPKKSFFIDPANSTGPVNMAMKNYYKNVAGVITYYVLATVPLKHIHDIFAKLPLSRGVYMRLTINTNANTSCVVTRSTGAAGTISTYATTSLHNVCPFMLSPIAGGIVGGANTSFNISSQIVGSHPMTQCRIYACTYTMSPTFEERYFAENGIKKVFYDDRLIFPIKNVAAGTDISQIISNGVSRLKSILIIPQLSDSIHGSLNAYDKDYTAGVGKLYSPSNSPFSSSPSTNCPYSFISNFNVLLSGQAHYQENLQYGWQQYLYETRGVSLNGGMSDMLSSGLISQDDWNMGYGFVYVDFTRKASQAQDDVSRSIQINGRNASSCAMDYLCIITYGRTISLNTSSGALTF